jgi:hypothetical protein
MTTYFKNNMHYYIMHNISSFFQTYNEIKMKITRQRGGIELGRGQGSRPLYGKF